jgi:hypothetical protein
MKLLAATIATLSLLASSLAQADWHGATPTTAMTHIAIQETLNGKNVDWMEKVSDEQYRK